VSSLRFYTEVRRIQHLNTGKFYVAGQTLHWFCLLSHLYECQSLTHGTPMSFSSLALFKMVDLKVYLCSMFGRCLPMCMCFHFSGWNLNNHVSLQSDSLFRSFCSCSVSSFLLIILHILVSSASKYVSDLTKNDKA
jgi:hypothetical protein